jgi:hypothetical protein
MQIVKDSNEFLLQAEAPERKTFSRSTGPELLSPRDKSSMN